MQSPRYDDANNDFQVLTEEERQVYIKCLRDTARYTSLLTGATGAGSIHILQVLSFPMVAKPSKMLTFIGGVIGYTIGKVMSASRCLQQVASMPNSTLAARIEEQRERQRQLWTASRHATPPKVDEQTETEPSLEIPEYQPIDSLDGFHSINGRSEYNWDDNLNMNSTEEPQQQTKISYEELRRKHRELDRQRIHTDVPVVSKPVLEKEKSNVRKENTTKYGDVWE